MSAGMCIHCGAAIPYGLARCVPCVDEKMAIAEARREQVLASVAGLPRKGNRKFPVRTEAEKRWRDVVGRATDVAVRAGLLPDPRDCACADCNAPAECFDHPNYNRPLYVVPVCLPCNGARGRGAMPVVQTVESLHELHAITRQQQAA